jgi:enoyl-CoA hydratase/carnithine racemase
MSAHAVVRLAVDGAVATITIDNPAGRNAMTRAMWEQIPALFTRLADDVAVRAAVLTGTGEHFCAGADINGLLSDDGTQQEARRAITAAEAAMTAFPKPLIAAIRGFCLGGGCQLATACDIRLAAQGAVLALPPAKLGVVYPAASLRRLARLIGPGMAKRMLFTAEHLTAERAREVGLVQDVVPGEVLDAHARGLAETMAGLSQLSLQAGKELLDADDLDKALAAEQRWVELSSSSGEAAEGVQSFLQRRPAAFPWRSP